MVGLVVVDGWIVRTGSVLSFNHHSLPTFPLPTISSIFAPFSWRGIWRKDERATRAWRRARTRHGPPAIYPHTAAIAPHSSFWRAPAVAAHGMPPAAAFSCAAGVRSVRRSMPHMNNIFFRARQINAAKRAAVRIARAQRRAHTRAALILYRARSAAYSRRLCLTFGC